MKNINEIAKDIFWESSLSRIHQHSIEHDTGFITAYRGDESKKINKMKNKALAGMLQSMGYGITAVKGSYIENYGTSDAKEVGENTYFVTDIKDKGKLKKDLMKLGEKFNQDSVLFVTKGGDVSTLIGTNNAEFPGFHKVLKMKNAVYGKSGEFMTKIKGRPFIFKEVIENVSYAGNIMGQEACKVAANKILEKIDELKKTKITKT